MTSLSTIEIQRERENERMQLTHKILVEVKKRPLLWRKVDPSYKHRLALHHAWEEIGWAIGIKPSLAKLRWRYLRDIYQKELKRIQRQVVQGGDIKDLKLWKYFKNMMFLKEEYMDTDLYPAIEVEEVEPELEQPESQDENAIVKIEDDENSNSSIEQLQEEHLQERNVLGKSIETNQVSRETANSTDPKETTENVTANVIEILETSHTPQVVNDLDISVAEGTSTAKKRKTYTRKKSVEDKTQAEDKIEEDMLFVKSLVPYFKDLDPVRKLRLKSRIQNLIADELAKDQD